jgi:hypothetical protein
MNIPLTLLDAMNEVPSEDGRALMPPELARYLISADDPALTEIKDASEARKRDISRMEYLARKRRVTNCQNRVDSYDYPNTPRGTGANYQARGRCSQLYDRPASP